MTFIQLTYYEDDIGRELVKPFNANKEQIAIFIHCSNGMTGVTVSYFNTTVAPLLKVHGIEEWDFV